MRRINKFFNQLKPETFFVTISLVFGTIFLFMFPPMTTPDEVGHFGKAYAFSEGKVVPFFEDVEGNAFRTWNKIGFNLPQSIVDLNNRSIEISYNVEAKYDYSGLKAENYTIQDEGFVPLGGQTAYSFFQYLPQIAGIALAKTFTYSIYDVYFLAKFFNFLAYVIVVWLAIKMAKYGKWAFALLGLNPMFLELATSTSGDGFTNAASFLFTAMLSTLIFEEKLNRNKLYLSFLIMISLVQMKPTLITFGLLYFLIPNRKFSLKSKMVYGTLVLVLSVGIYILWSKLFPSQNEIYIDFAEPKEQIKFVLQNPIAFVKILIRTILNHTKFLLHSYSGQFALLNRNISFGAVLGYYLLVLIAITIKTKEETLVVTPVMRLTSLTFLATYVGLSFLALYQIWNHAGASEILGLQGRYFIPSGPFALMCITPNKNLISGSVVKMLVIVFMLCFLIYTVLFLNQSYGWLF